MSHDLNKLPELLTGIVSALSDKGYGVGSAYLTLSDTGYPRIYSYLRLESFDPKFELQGNEDETLSDFLYRTLRAAHAYPTAEEFKKTEWRKSLAHLVEQGEAAGIEVAFLNPLIEQMKALSFNIIEAPKVAQVGWPN